MLIYRDLEPVDEDSTGNIFGIIFFYYIFITQFLLYMY